MVIETHTKSPILSPPKQKGIMMIEWQDIKTAPKTGVYFIGYWPHMSRGSMAHEGQYRTRWTEWGGGCWEADALGKPVELPTHWMPLPSPPAQLLPVDRWPSEMRRMVE